MTGYSNKHVQQDRPRGVTGEGCHQFATRYCFVGNKATAPTIGESAICWTSTRVSRLNSASRYKTSPGSKRLRRPGTCHVFVFAQQTRISQVLTKYISAAETLQAVAITSQLEGLYAFRFTSCHANCYNACLPDHFVLLQCLVSCSSTKWSSPSHKCQSCITATAKHNAEKNFMTILTASQISSPAPQSTRINHSCTHNAIR